MKFDNISWLILLVIFIVFKFTKCSMNDHDNLHCSNCDLAPDEPNRVCYRGQCFCKPNYQKEYNNEVGDNDFMEYVCKVFTCLREGQCQAYDLNRHCDKGECKCRTGYKPSGSDSDGQLCLKSCSSDNQCDNQRQRCLNDVCVDGCRTSDDCPEHQTCQQGVCQCQEPYYKAADTTCMKHPISSTRLALAIALPLITCSVILALVGGYCWRKHKLNKQPGDHHARVDSHAPGSCCTGNNVSMDHHANRQPFNVHNDYVGIAETPRPALPVAPREPPPSYLSIISDSSPGYYIDEIYETITPRESNGLNSGNQDAYENIRNGQAYYGNTIEHDAVEIRPALTKQEQIFMQV